MIPLNALFGGHSSPYGGFFGQGQQPQPQQPIIDLSHGGWMGNMVRQNNAMPQQHPHPEFWGQLMALLRGGHPLMGGM